MTTEEQPEYLTVEEVADKLRISDRAVQRLCQSGELGSTKAGRRFLIPPASLDEYLKIRR